VQHWHRAAGDASAEAVADDDVVALAQLGDEGLEGTEVVAVVAVAHHDEGPARGAESGLERRTVAALRGDDHARAGRLRRRDRSIRAAVVDDDDLAGNAGIAQEVRGLGDARSDRALLVEAGHDDRELGKRDARLLGRERINGTRGQVFHDGR
jgi:hypothetical protein